MVVGAGCGNSAESVSPLTVTLAENNDGQPTAVAQAYGVQFSPQPISLDREGDPSEPAGVMQSYYHYYKAGQLSKIVEMSYAGDGTRSEKSEAIEAGTMDPAAVSKIDSIIIPYRLQWGRVSLLNTQLVHNETVVGQWNHAVVCDNECFMSSMLWSDKDGADVVSALLYSIMAEGFSSETIQHDFSFEIPSPVGEADPISILIDFVGDTQSGLRIYPDNEAGEDFATISTLIRTITSTKNSIPFEEVNELLSESFHGFKASRLISQYRINDEQEAHAASYTPYAFYGVLNGLKEARLIGEIKSGNESFVLLDTLSKDGPRPLLIIKGKDGQLRQRPENSVLKQVLMSDFGAGAIYDLLER